MTKEERERSEAIEEVIRATMCHRRTCMCSKVCKSGPCWCAGEIWRAVSEVLALSAGQSPTLSENK